MSIDTQLNHYFLAARAEGISQANICHVSHAVRLFAAFLGGIPHVGKVTRQDLQRFIAVGLRQKQTWAERPDIKVRHNLSPQSINTYVRGVKAFWGWLQREGAVKTNPLADVKVPKIQKKLPKTISEHELKAILKTLEERIKAEDDKQLCGAGTRDRAMFLTFIDSGLRLQELSNISVSDLDLHANSIKVLGKGGKERMVFISPETAVALSTYIIFSQFAQFLPDQGTGYLFVTQSGGQLKPHRIQKILYDLGKRAGISKRLSPHKLRHSFATLSLKYGGNLEYLRRVMGHADSKTTEIYLSVADADVAKAHETFSPVSNLRKSRD